MYNFQMTPESAREKAAKWGAILGRDVAVRQQSPRWPVVHFYQSHEEIQENAERSARLYAAEFEVPHTLHEAWIPAYVVAWIKAYTDFVKSYKAERDLHEQCAAKAAQIARDLRTRPTRPRQTEEW